VRFSLMVPRLNVGQYHELSSLPVCNRDRRARLTQFPFGGSAVVEGTLQGRPVCV
jgi:hypothetical protein